MDSNTSRERGPSSPWFHRWASRPWHAGRRCRQRDGSSETEGSVVAHRPSTMRSLSPGYGPGFPVSPIPSANVASVPQRSPLRYPGGKTWLIPHIRAWLSPIQPRPKNLIEPFGGGGTVALTAVCEALAERSIVVELDHDVAAFWHAALRHNSDLCRLVAEFQPSLEAVSALANGPNRDLLEHGFRTLVLNRTRRGGILAPRSCLNEIWRE